MQGNFYKSMFGLTAFGESHGKYIGVVIDDVKPNIDFDIEEIQNLLNKRKPGQNSFSSSRTEPDKLIVASGVFNGKTTGMPICLLVENTNQNSNDYEAIKNIFRPGHADFSWFNKYKIYDYRGGGRASGRETIARVAASGLCNKILKDIEILPYVTQVANIKAIQTNIDFACKNPLLWACPESYEQVSSFLQTLPPDRAGGKLNILIKNVPKGLGDPVFEKLDANLAKALMSIGSVKAIEFGIGFDFCAKTSSKCNDERDLAGFKSNNSGGILGGVSTGQNILISLAIKPAPSHGFKQKTVDVNNKEHTIEIKGRHDTFTLPRVAQVAVAMVKLCLADSIAYQNLIEENKQNLTNFREAIEKIDNDILLAIARRNELSKQIGKFKKANGLDIEDKGREELRIKQISKIAKQLNISEACVKKIWQSLFTESKKQQ